MDSWGNSGHFMSILGVIPEKEFDFSGNLIGRHVAPLMNQSLKHCNGAKLIDLSQSTKSAQFIIGKTHIRFILFQGLHTGFTKMLLLELHIRFMVHELFNALEASSFMAPSNISSQVGFGEATNWVDIA